jgi:hypothetical protein
MGNDTGICVLFERFLKFYFFKIKIKNIENTIDPMTSNNYKPYLKHLRLDTL